MLLYRRFLFILKKIRELRSYLILGIAFYVCCFLFIVQSLSPKSQYQTVLNKTSNSIEPDSRNVMIFGEKATLAPPRCHPPEGFETVSKQRDEWILLSTPSGKDRIAVYSAFFDDRFSILPDFNQTYNYVRIMALLTFNNSIYQNQTIYCFLFDDNSTTSYTTVKAIIDLTGRRSGYFLNRIQYIQYMISCRLPDQTSVPQWVSLGYSTCLGSHLLIPVQIPPKQLQRQVTICVPISFGHIPEPLFVEWMEFYRMMGVRKVNIYDAGMYNMSAVFDYYHRLGMLDVYKLSPIVPNNGLTGIKLNSAISLNDCMMRHLYQSKYILAIDFDEFVLPRKYSNYNTLIDYLETRATSMYAAKPSDNLKTKKNRLKLDVSKNFMWAKITFIFRNILFFLDHPRNKDKKKSLFITSSVYRYLSPSFLSGAKSFVNPRQCYIIFNHVCLLDMVPGPGNERMQVPEDVAANHHFRLCNLESKDCKINFGEKETDLSALRIENRLSRIVEAVKVVLNTTRS